MEERGGGTTHKVTCCGQGKNEQGSDLIEKEGPGVLEELL
jgi:hypothetical protein